jgi:hypothetical protein
MRPMLSSHQILTRSTIGHNSLSPTEGDRSVIRLCPRGGGLRPDLRLVRSDTMGDPPVAGMERYECGSENEEDYRHRMLINLLAAVFLLALIITGTWIVNTIAQTTQEGRNIARTVRGTSATALEEGDSAPTGIQHLGN